MARTIKIGKQQFREGTPVLIQNIVDPGPKMSDRDLNGKIGKLTFKHAHIAYGVIGVWITGKDQKGGRIQIPVNLNINEFTEKI